MGQEVSCCRQKSSEQGIERIFDNNYQIAKEHIQLLGPEQDRIYPSRKSKLIKLHKVACDENAAQAKPAGQLLSSSSQQLNNLHQRINSISHSRQFSSTSYTLRESNFQNTGDNNQIRTSFDVKNIHQTNHNNNNNISNSNINNNNNYLSVNNNYNTLSTHDTQNNYTSNNNNNNGYLCSPSSYELDQFQPTVVPNNQSNNNNNTERAYTVRETYLDGSNYEGEKLNEYRQGYGVFVFSNKACYKGNWANDKMNGKGLLYYSSGQLAYQGQFSENKFEGYGYLNNETIDYNMREDDEKYYQDFTNIGNKWVKYEGEFQNDGKNGRGRLYFSNGDFIIADFIDDKINGECVLYKANNHIIKGYWRDNKLIRVTY